MLRRNGRLSPTAKFILRTIVVSMLLNCLGSIPHPCKALAADLTSHGFLCEVEPASAPPRIETGSCEISGEFAVLSVYQDAGQWNAFVPTLEHSAAYRGSIWVVGPNWGIGLDTEATASSVRDQLGGRIIVGAGQ